MGFIKNGKSNGNRQEWSQPGDELGPRAGGGVCRHYRSPGSNEIEQVAVTIERWQQLDILVNNAGRGVAYVSERFFSEPTRLFNCSTRQSSFRHSYGESTQLPMESPAGE